MTTEHSQLITEEANPSEVRTSEALLPGEAAEALELWFQRWREGAAHSIATVEELARALGVDEANARELVREARTRRLQGEVEAVAAAVYRNRRRKPTLVWSLIAVVALLLMAAMLGTIRVSRSVPSSAVQEGPAHSLDLQEPTTSPAPAGAGPR